VANTFSLLRFFYAVVLCKTFLAVSVFLWVSDLYCRHKFSRH